MIERVPTSSCPKCGSGPLRTKIGGIDAGAGTGCYVNVGGSGTRASPVRTYLCTACGYFEQYVADPATLQRASESWDPAT